MRILSSILFCAISCVGALQSQAGYIVHLDLDPADGIQATRTVNLGDLVTANVFLSSTSAADRLIAYNFHLRFNENVLTFQTPRLETPENLLGGFGNGSLNGKDTVGGLVRNLDGISTGTGSSGIIAPVRIASLTFRATGLGVSDLTPGIFEPNRNEWIDDQGNNIAPSVTFQGASITAVPEPSSLALLAVVGSISAYGIRRKRKRQLMKA